MNRIVIFGNSGSGKSTLARQESARLGCAHLDLDTLAWDPRHPAPTRLPIAESKARIDAFLAHNSEWVIEGCYADLIELALPSASRVVFLNPGVEVCAANCRKRPWEPHKYASPEAQDANLEMLLAWVAEYPNRQDALSLGAHRRLFDGFAGPKVEHRSNDR